MDRIGPGGPRGPQPPLVDQERSGPPWTMLRHFPDAYVETSILSVLRKLSKEGEVILLPVSARIIDSKLNWPSIVIKIGVSKHLRLYEDASWYQKNFKALHQRGFKLLHQ